MGRCQSHKEEEWHKGAHINLGIGLTANDLGQNYKSAPKQMEEVPPNSLDTNGIAQMVEVFMVHETLEKE